MPPFLLAMALHSALYVKMQMDTQFSKAQVLLIARKHIELPLRLHGLIKCT